jgi:hypothetical protein
VGTQGTLGTVLEGVTEGIEAKEDGKNDNKTQDTEDTIKPENSPTHTLEASPPSPQFECRLQGCGKRFNSQSELIAHMDKESAEARESLGK